MEKELSQALQALKRRNTILYPTDTVWGIGCDATEAEAVQKVYELKNRPNHKALICLVSDLAMLENHVQKVPDKARQIIAESQQPTTIIYDNPVHIAPNLIGSDNSLAIRLCRNPFCRALLQAFGKPIVSTSANISGQPTPKSFSQIQPEIIKGVNYVVNLHREKQNSRPSKIIRITPAGKAEIIRD